MHNNKPEMRSMETVGGGSVTFMSLLILFPDLSFNALVVGIRDYSTAMRLSGSSLRHQTFFFFSSLLSQAQSRSSSTATVNPVAGAQ